jgi:His-Xaa-Ser system radical SAM maturase HxsC
MKTYKGIPQNISGIVMGKVRKEHSIFFLNNVLVCENIPKLTWGCKALITSANISKKSINKPIVYCVDNINEFNDGDIVQIFPNGNIKLLYERASDDNIILITNKCNCSCIMCPQKESDEETTIEEKKYFISHIDRNTRHIGLTGGEPTVLREELLEVIAYCKNNLPETSIELLTNGILLSDVDYVKDVLALKHHSITFQIPLYSDIDKIHNYIVGRDTFYDTIKAIYNLSLYNQKIEIRNVIMSVNYKRLPQYAEYVYRNIPFTIHIALMGIECMGMAKNNIKDLWIDPIDYMYELESAVKILRRKDLNVSLYNHQLCTLPEYLWPFAPKSISSWKRVYIDECNSCSIKDTCGGFFESTKDNISRGIHSIN